MLCRVNYLRGRPYYFMKIWLSLIEVKKFDINRFTQRKQSEVFKKRQKFYKTCQKSDYRLRFLQYYNHSWEYLKVLGFIGCGVHRQFRKWKTIHGEYHAALLDETVKAKHLHLARKYVLSNKAMFLLTLSQLQSQSFMNYRTNYSHMHCTCQI